MLWETISKKLSEKNWTIYKLCLEAGIGTAGIYRLRDGVIKDLQFETVRKIADALDMSLEEFRQKGKFIVIRIEIENLSDFIECAKEVVKKAEELEGAVRRLNEMELELKTKTTNQ